MLDRYLIWNCSPTLASLKTANLFTVDYVLYSELQENLDFWNTNLYSKGIKLSILRKKDNKALIYVYREKLLMQDLNKTGVKEFLEEYGYRNIDTNYAVEMLKSRIEESIEFPHEIGLFLGYPFEDVKEFIAHDGKNCKCVGCWKVYYNECESIRRFELFKKCTNLYRFHWNKGKSIMKLAITV